MDDRDALVIFMVSEKIGGHMKKYGELIAIVLVIGTIAVTYWAIFAYEARLKNKRNTIDIEAYPISQWSKKEIRVKKGELVRIRIINKDCVTHGFAIPGLDVDEKIIRAGEDEIVEFTPEWEGEYLYKCVVQCDREMHDFMTGKLIVEE